MTKTSAPCHDLRNPSSQSIDVDVEVVGRLVEQQQVRRRHQRARQQHAPLHAAGQARERRIAVQLQAVEGFLDAPVERPGMRRFDLRLHARERVRIDVLGMADAMELREQRARFAQARRDDVEHRARRIARHFLLEARDAAAAFQAHLAVVGA